MKYQFDKKNKDKISSFLNLKDKCTYYEKEILTDFYNINKNNWGFLYYHSFFSLVRDISDLSLFFLINEEISNSIEREPYSELIIDIIQNHYKNYIIINNEKIILDNKYLFHTKAEIKELLVYKFNGILDSQLFDFYTSVFSAFEFWISKLYSKYSEKFNNELIESRKNKYIKLIEKYNTANEDEKKKLLDKILSLPSQYISFPDKINMLYKKISKSKYEEKRNINNDKALIDFLRTIRNTIHNSGIHTGKDKKFEFNHIQYEFKNNKPLFIPNHNEMILMYGELVDIFEFIIYSLEGLDYSDIVTEDKNEDTIAIFHHFITSYKSININNKEERKLFLKKVLKDDNKVENVIKYLNAKSNIDEDKILKEILSADL